MTRRSPLVTHHGYFVTGTDTGVGKTVVACALLAALAGRGKRAIGMKPVACGGEPGTDTLLNDDVERLLAAGNVDAPREHVNPYGFAPAIAPHIAARQAGVVIDLDRVEKSFRVLAGMADAVVVEGVGGFHVPLGSGADTAQLAARLALPVVLVVGMRLGCLNHALLTANAVSGCGLKLAGWIANHVDPEMAVAEDNVRALDERIGAPRIGRISFHREPDYRAISMSLRLPDLE
jgi:dethiobiotin synthetase